MLGLPIVALQLDEGYQAGEADWIWSSSDPRQLAGHMAQLIDDEERLRSLAASQQAYALANHDVQAMCLAYDRFYQDVLARTVS